MSKTLKQIAVILDAINLSIELASELFEQRHGLRAFDGRKVVEKLIKWVARRKVIKERRDMHARSCEDLRAAEDVRVARHQHKRFSRHISIL